MIFKDICTKKVYTQNGAEKVKWLNAGTMKILDDGKTFIELNMFPNTPFYVFDQKAKEPQKPVNSDADDVETVEL